MWEWARGIKLPRSYAIPGPFSTSTTRQLEPVMGSIQDETVREVTVCKAIQTGGTLGAVEIPIIYLAVNEPGPMMWTQQTDKAVKEHSKGRFNSLIRKVPQIKAILPPGRHEVTTTEIYFGDFFLIINAANLNSLQSKSIRYKFNSECWLWEQGLLKHARGRVSKFEEVGTSKVVNESQASYEGDDFHKAFLEGHQGVWSVKCQGCAAYSALEFFGRDKSDPEKKACVIWNQDARKKDGTWNVSRAAATARWACPNCGHEHADTPRTRTLWNADGMYISQNPTAAATHKSYRWTALVSRPLSSLVTEFLNANAAAKMGLTADLRDFKMQRLSMFWKEDDNSAEIVLKGSGYTLASITSPAEKLPNEANRFVTIDRQRDHFWILVRAWMRDGASRLLYFSRVTTPEQCEDVRILYGVERQLTFEDAGYFPEGVYTDCAKWGWTALKGSGDNYFTVEIQVPGRNELQKIKRLWTNVTRVQHNGKMVNLFHWASDPIKDVLYKLRSGQAAKWETPDDIGLEYPNQLTGDRKKAFLNKKSGRPEHRWQRVHANHAHDLEAMQAGVAMMLGILIPPEPQEDKEAITNAEKK